MKTKTKKAPAKTDILELILKSVAAGFLISLGCYGVLYIENSLVSAVLFSFGLLTVCAFGLNLFTGKCGFIFENNEWWQLGVILVVNLLSGYGFGWIYSIATPSLIEKAAAKVNSWTVSLPYFILSCLCGAIMYIAVKIYKIRTLPAGTNSLGILIGVPMFILCGFQHCIANVITMGVARSFNPALFLCILGNFCGSLFIWFISKDKN